MCHQEEDGRRRLDVMSAENFSSVCGVRRSTLSTGIPFLPPPVGPSDLMPYRFKNRTVSIGEGPSHFYAVDRQQPSRCSQQEDDGSCVSRLS